MLFITEPANGDLIVESPINEGHVRMYRPGGKTQTPAGQAGTITMTTTRVGAGLASEGEVVSAGGPTTRVKETYTVSPDGNVLSIDVVSAAAETKTSALRYTRITAVGPCESWPTPCKRFQ